MHNYFSDSFLGLKGLHGNCVTQPAVAKILTLWQNESAESYVAEIITKDSK